MAFHWLVCLDPPVADDYHAGRIPKPVEVRRRLEALGVDVSHVRDSYAAGSEIGHVGRASERFHLEMHGDNSGELMIGGAFRRADLEHWLEYLPALLDLFQEPILAATRSGEHSA